MVSHTTRGLVLKALLPSLGRQYQYLYLHLAQRQPSQTRNILFLPFLPKPQLLGKLTFLREKARSSALFTLAANLFQT